jgi:hypothetical protein
MITVDLSAQEIVLGAVNDTEAKTETNIIPGVELIEYVGNTLSVKGKITAIVYSLNNSDSKPIRIIKPHLYKVSGKKVGEELLPTDIAPIRVTTRGKRITLQVDISKYKIELPVDGVFVGIEFTGTEPEDVNRTHPLTVWRNELNTSSISFMKYKNTFRTDERTLSQGLCFGIQIKEE